MIPYIYLIVLMGIFLIGLAFYFREYAFGALGSMLFIIIGIYTAVNGITGVDNFLTVALSVIIIAVGAYIFIRGGFEAIS